MRVVVAALAWIPFLSAIADTIHVPGDFPTIQEAIGAASDDDVDGDAHVNPVDTGLVQGAFGSGEEADLCCYDMDCDGQINPVNSGIVQTLFGTCEPPRDVCP